MIEIPLGTLNPQHLTISLDEKIYNLNNHQIKLLYLIENFDENIIQNLSKIITFFVENDSKKLDLLIFSSFPEKFNSLFCSNVINAKYSELNIKRFQHSSHFYLYDKKGFLLIDGELSNKPEVVIWAVSDLVGLKLQKWIPTKIVNINDNISTNSYLKFLQNNLEFSKFATSILIFLDDICSSCPSGQIINEFNMFQLENVNLKCYVVLSSKYGKNDLENIKNNNNLAISFLINGKEIEDYNQSHIKTNFISTINGMSIVINKKGSVIFFVDLINEKNQFSINDYYSFKNFLLSLKSRTIGEIEK